MSKIKMLCLFLFFLVSKTAFSQNNTIFYANASSKTVMEGSEFTVEFIANNIKLVNFQPPVFNNFDVIGGPNQTSSYSNNNGKVSQQFIIGYVLRAQKPGKFRIESGYCDYNGQKLATVPFEIQVIKSDSKSKAALGLPTDKDIFVRMEVAKETIYIGEKVELNYKLYTTKNVRSYDINSESAFNGFFTKPKPSRTKEASQEEIDGIVYSVQILETRLLYPQQTGNFKIEPALISLGLPDNSQRNNSFFFGSNLKPFPVRTNELNLTVIDLPKGAPNSFSGAVGKFQMQASIDKTSLSTDDAVTISITVAGNGDAKYMLPPSQDHLTSLDIYDPNTIERGERESFGELQTIKTFEYLAVPLKTGSITIVPEFSYFDTDSIAYVTLKSTPFTLQVTQGKNKTQVNLVEQSNSSRTISGLLKPKKLYQETKSPFGGPIHLGFIFISFLGLGFIFFQKRKLEIEAGIDPATRKRNKARKVAEQRLSKAKEYIVEKNFRAFYEEISKSLLGFIADKLNVPPSEISKSNVALKLKSKEVNDELIKEIGDILLKSEIAIFAGKSDADVDNTYEKTKNIITTLADLI